ncbi:MAG: exodeoxyribonuclease V subunit gamma [Methylobacter tundripaludum]|uniref:RecBCD enzyme subunit RecC n=1 Tax=Methylobacter tundripaludum TaxID=173365 RepID=A0A2S6H2F6_9GAMM|nr:exodeoxyribonuclease V subunit gamma [Methylobacter tundripaludum]MCK9637410.1 exodeoxyribonuclease V subunit gamma [Methylobacter tundripaludum]PPK71610.1 DNA helicase/exodeoxyribonuclease V gamma subunit [Methylobacter tundripaludum]
MFILHSSNKTENLVAHLCAVIENSPLASPFAKEVFLIQSQGMERWLSQQLAGRFKVWGNYEFLFPGKFFSSLAQNIDSRLSDAAFERNLMLWRIEALLRRLPGMATETAPGSPRHFLPPWRSEVSQSVGNRCDRLDGEVFLPLTQYLSGENVALKRYQLAQQLAQIFDQYQMMRPDMLEAWQKGQLLYQTTTERWQQALWLQITEQTGNKHRGSLWLDVIAKLNAAEEGAFSGQLPERISVFGLNTMPPLFLSYLQGLSKHCQLHLFLLNPAQDFWADLATKRQRAIDENFTGHPLLSTLGQQGREFQEMLLDQAQFDFEPESFELGEARTHLQRLQNGILNNRLDGQVLQQDDSISIHACHSRMREVEVLKNQLLQTLENDPSLELRDIVVMAPDIQVYEPFISAVFDDVQHAVADRSLRLSNNALDAFIRFLDLSQSRFGWQSVLDLLEQPVVYPGFGLSEVDLELIKHWVQDTHVRWGKSAQHKQELGLPELSENTWQAMLDRLLMGYAVGSDQDFIAEVLPYRDIEGSSALALGGLCDFMQLLFKASKELKQAKPLKSWSAQLYYYADQLLAAAEPVERRQLNELLAELSAELAAVHNDDVELQVIISWLEGMVAERKSSNGFLRGQLTFCSMLPMRSIPFKVIALLGMNDGEFPKIDRHPTFDLLAHNFRKGDRSHRSDDRYQFLEILLSARQRLIMTYIGQSISHNDAIPPSVVISELLEVLQCGGLITRHPLQPFSRRYFDGAADLFSFSETDCETARALSGRGDRPSALVDLWWQGAILEDAAETEVIELSELFSFFRHPQRYFVQRQMDLRFSGMEADAEEREPFSVDKLEGYAIYHEWIHEALNGKQPTVKKLQAQGRWLAGVPGELEFDRQQQAINEFVQRIKEKDLGASLDDLPVDIIVGQYRLAGKLGNLYQHGSLIYRYAALKGKDFVCALLHHLIINEVQRQSSAIAPCIALGNRSLHCSTSPIRGVVPPASMQSTFLLSTDEDLSLLPEHCQAEQLSAWIEIYRQGRKQPDAFFVEPALAYIKQAHKLQIGSRASKSALDAAIEQLSRAVEQPYEPELRRLYGNVADLGQVLGEPFELQCQSLLQPVWDVLHQ